jgi:hypothetical protein
MLPADGTIAARVAHQELGISRWQLENRLHPFSSSRKTAISVTNPKIAGSVGNVLVGVSPLTLQL